MKVLLVNNLYGRYARGGAERVLDSIIDGLVALGHEPVVFTAGPFRWRWFLWPRIDAEESIRTYRFYPNNIFSIVTINKRPKWLRAIWHGIDTVNDHPAWVLWWIIRREKPDIVWTHNLKGLGSWIPPLLRWLELRHIHQLHDVQLIEPSGLLFPSQLEFMSQKYSDVLNPGRRALCALYGARNIRIDRAVREGLRRIYACWYRWSMGFPTLVVSPTRWLLELHQQHGFFLATPDLAKTDKDSKTLVLANPTPSSPVRVGRSVILRQASATGGSSRGGQDDTKIRAPFYLLFAGQLVWHKGIQFLVDTLKDARFPFAWELHIAGTGALESKLRATLAGDPRFIFHGKLSAQPFEDVWSQTDLTIVPSLCLENAPTVIVESLRRGIPVLASRVGGIAEMLEEGENGWLFLPGDCNNFIEKFSSAAQRIAEGFTSVHSTVKTPEHYTQSVLSEFLSHGS